MFIAMAFLSGVSSAQTENPPPATVPSVDLERYAGLWYEIAKIPNRFQKKCAANTTAYYSIRRDGKIDVINRCMKSNGEFDEAKGIARVEDTVSNAKLKVSFVRLLGIQMFWGDYWIIGLGDDYEYAVVGTPDRKYGWILSRTPDLDAAKLQTITELLRRQGYDPADFEMTHH
jgi:apolipoprotein D and lipocalin family protein